MKRLLLLLFALGLSACAGAGSGMPPTNATTGAARSIHPSFNGSSDVVQFAVAHTHSTSTTCTFTNTPTAGNTLVFGVGLYPGSATTTAPNGVTTIDAAANSQMRTYYRVVQPGDGNAWTFTASVSSYLTVGCYEIAGANTSSPIDAHRAQNVSNETTISTPSVTPVTSGDLPVAFFGDAQSGVFSNLTAGWTNDINQSAAAFFMYGAHGPIAGTSPVQASVTLAKAGYGGTALVLLAPAAQASPTPSPSPGPGNPPQVVQSGNGAQFAASTINVTFGKVPAAGDVMVVFFSNNGTASGGPITYTPPSGWIQIDLDSSHVYDSYSAFYHVAGNAERTTYPFTPSCVCRETTWIDGEYANVNTSSPIDRHGFNFINNSTSWVTPTLTPQQAGDLAVVAMMPISSSRTWSNAAGWTVDLGPTSTWSQELLHEAQSGTSPVSEASTLSAAAVGDAAIVLLSPGTGSGATKVDWDTWGMRPSRNSYNPVETTLSASNVGGLHQHWSTALGGVITDAPVVAANVPGTSQGTADLLFVGDAQANFYAMNAQTGAIVWQKTLQRQFIDGNAQATLGCFDQPNGIYGIGGSPTVDRARNLVFVVDALGNFYGFDLATGAQKIGPVAMWPFQNGVNITNDYGALTEDSNAGLIYVPSGAHCGLANYGGIHAYNIGSGAVTHWYTEGLPPNDYGGVWGPGGPVIDPRRTSNSAMNNIYFATAFGPLGTNRYPYSVVRLTSSLQLVAANNPVTTTCCPDLDFGDTPLVFTPTSSGCTATLVAAESKNGVFYVYNADAINSGPIQSIQLGTSTEEGINLGTPAYDPTTNLLVIQNAGDSSNTASGLLHGVVAFTVNAACTLQFAWQQTLGPNKIPDGPTGPPTIANGVVYYVNGPGAVNCSPVAHQCPAGQQADFYALQETNGAILFHKPLPTGLFTAPVVVNGTVYVTTWNGEGPGIVYAFGL
jgi:PQQ-like domain